MTTTGKKTKRAKTTNGANTTQAALKSFDRARPDWLPLHAAKMRFFPGYATTGTDRYGRTVATCAVAGADMGAWLVAQGLALDWPRYSGGNRFQLRSYELFCGLERIDEGSPLHNNGYKKSSVIWHNTAK